MRVTYCVKWMIMLAALSLTLATAALAGPAVGSAAQDFNLTSGDEKATVLADYQGKVLVVFYEDKDKVEVNRPLKQALNAIFNPTSSARLSVVDATDAGFFSRGIWESNLREASEREGMIIYGDWDGKMKKAYGLAEETTSFFIVDKKGTVRFFRQGKVAQTEFAEITALLVQLAKE